MVTACDGEPADPCVLGAERVCSCDEVGSGRQQCSSNGWSECVCGGDGDADGDIDSDGVVCDGDRPLLCSHAALSACVEADADCATLTACGGDVVACALGEVVRCPEEGMPLCEPRQGWVVVSPGTFAMGSPEDEEGRRANETQHEVTLTHALLIQATEVTQAQLLSLLGVNPTEHPDCGESCPADNLSWQDAVGACNALSRLEGLEECYEPCTCRLREDLDSVYDCSGYRLPTEAEWEYAARAGVTGARDGDLDEIAWWEESSGDTIHPVGSLAPNDWGLYDMLGNVSEWCMDKYETDLGVEPATDPCNLRGFSDRVFRGGSFSSGGDRLRAAFRSSGQAAMPISGAGFRPVRSIP